MRRLLGNLYHCGSIALKKPLKVVDMADFLSIHFDKEHQKKLEEPKKKSARSNTPESVGRDKKEETGDLRDNEKNEDGQDNKSKSKLEELKKGGRRLKVLEGVEPDKKGETIDRDKEKNEDGQDNKSTKSKRK